MHGNVERNEIGLTHVPFMKAADREIQYADLVPGAAQPFGGRR
jgi:hypothetical protein